METNKKSNNGHMWLLWYSLAEIEHWPFNIGFWVNFQFHNHKITVSSLLKIILLHGLSIWRPDSLNYLHGFHRQRTVQRNSIFQLTQISSKKISPETFTCPSGKSRVKSTSLTAKSHSQGYWTSTSLYTAKESLKLIVLNCKINVMLL